MSHKRDKIDAIVQSFRGQELDPHYLGYFDCFNRQLYFEAHEVLEALWLTKRGGPEDAFYKGLIQLAGAFVHVQKQRTPPAIALLRLARANLERYPAICHRLDLAQILQLIKVWVASLTTGGASDGSALRLSTTPPRLELKA